MDTRKMRPMGYNDLWECEVRPRNQANSSAALIQWGRMRGVGYDRSRGSGVSASALQNNVTPRAHALRRLGSRLCDYDMVMTRRRTTTRGTTFPACRRGFRCTRWLIGFPPPAGRPPRGDHSLQALHWGRGAKQRSGLWARALAPGAPEHTAG